MKVRARFFALYRERMGRDQLEVELGDDAVVADLIQHLDRQYPHLSSNPQRIVVAVNQEYAGHEHPLREGDEVVFIPPVSGG